MKKQVIISGLAAMIISVSISLPGIAWGEVAAAEPAAVASEQLVMGQEEGSAGMVMITNKTGQDITYFSVVKYVPGEEENDIVILQNALIEQGFLDDVADGSYGPKTQKAVQDFRKEKGLSEDGDVDDEMLTLLLGEGYDGNLLNKDDVFKADETRTLYIPKEDTEKKEDAEEQIKPEDSLTEFLSDYEITPEYVITLKTADSETEYVQYVFPASLIESAEIYLEENISYLQYQTKDTTEAVSTLDLEKAIYDTVHAPAVQSYDYSYDYGYDYSYSAPYVVYEEYYPSCDDGSHGVLYQEWSDGTTTTTNY